MSIIWQRLALRDFEADLRHRHVRSLGTFDISSCTALAGLMNVRKMQPKPAARARACSTVLYYDCYDGHSLMQRRDFLW